MAYDRYDERRGIRQPSGRHDFGDDRDDRGFFDRARDEVASWFGDERAERRRDRDDDDWFDDDRRACSSERDYDRYQRSPRWRDEGYRRPYTGRFAGRQDEGRYRPMTGDYGRSSEWIEGRHPREFTGAASTAGAMHDRDYSNWRRRQLDDLDRDYDEFRRENASRFEDEFSNWRTTRQTKRQMLGQVSAHMPVVGSDGEPVGTVDKVRGDRIVLTRNDSTDGRHHAVSCGMVDKVEGDRVILDCKAEEAIAKLTSEDRNRALFERDDDREPGPHMLNRSFSGTY
jgi:hypothetical protein